MGLPEAVFFFQRATLSFYYERQTSPIGSGEIRPQGEDGDYAGRDQAVLLARGKIPATKRLLGKIGRCKKETLCFARSLPRVACCCGERERYG